MRVRTDRKGSARGYAGKGSLELGTRLSFSEADDRFDPLRALLLSLCAELAGRLTAEMARARAVLDDLEMVARLWLDDPMAAIGVVGAPGDGRVRRIEVSAFASTPDGDPVLQAAWRRACQGSVLARSLSAELDLQCKSV